MSELRDAKQVIVVRKDLNMRKGKLAAQVAHAAMSFLLARASLLDETDSGERRLRLFPVELEWLRTGTTKIVVGVDSEEALKDLAKEAEASGIRMIHRVIDKGLTEFHGQPTLTCIAFGPDDPEKLDKLTGHLRLL